MEKEQEKIPLLCMGNAIVDVLTQVNEGFIKAEEPNGMRKAAMTLIDEQRANELYTAMPSPSVVSGGSVANTAYCFVSLGGKSAFMGKVGGDALGRIFCDDLKQEGIINKVKIDFDAPGTSRCLIFITPDAERTMNTYLGASRLFTPNDVDAEVVKASKIFFLEGYLYDDPSAQEAANLAATMVRANGGEVAVTLSDVFCVERHRSNFMTLIMNNCDILFANEEEAKALTLNKKMDDVYKDLQRMCPLSLVTLGEKGAVIVTKDHVEHVPIVKKPKVVDLTGAGDAFASGFLFGYLKGTDLVQATRLGHVAASHVISVIGPRPKVTLSEFAEDIFDHVA